MPSRTAMAAASVRLVAPSLFRMLATWVCTVRLLTNSASPISLSVRPSTSRRSTSNSRGVSPAAAGQPGGFEPLAAEPLAKAGDETVVFWPLHRVDLGPRDVAQGRGNPV